MDAHDPEYQAAADAMAETYGSSPEPATYQPGQAVMFRLADWSYPKAGVVTRVTNTGHLSVTGEDGHRYLCFPEDVEARQ